MHTIEIPMPDGGVAEAYVARPAERQQRAPRRAVLHGRDRAASAHRGDGAADRRLGLRRARPQRVPPRGQRRGPRADGRPDAAGRARGVLQAGDAAGQGADLRQGGARHPGVPRRPCAASPASTTDRSGTTGYCMGARLARAHRRPRPRGRRRRRLPRRRPGHRRRRQPAPRPGPGSRRVRLRPRRQRPVDADRRRSRRWARPCGTPAWRPATRCTTVRRTATRCPTPRCTTRRPPSVTSRSSRACSTAPCTEPRAGEAAQSPMAAVGAGAPARDGGARGDLGIGGPGLRGQLMPGPNFSPS